MSRELFENKSVLAPMMVGSNRTFRRIAHEMGAGILGGEMAHAFRVRKTEKRELALISARQEEGVFSAQICGCKIETLVDAVKVIADRGAKIIDLNAGCPMNFVTDRGSGAALLTMSSAKLSRMVEALKRASPLAVSVKIRAGFWSDHKVRLREIAHAIESGGADAISIHARFRDQYYETPADWNHICEVVASVRIPVIGNGDINSWQDAERMRRETGCSSVMIGRAALQRPWIFQEIRERKTIDYSPEQRWTLFEKHFQMMVAEFSPKLALEMIRWHAGWYIRWREDHRTVRNRWAALTDPEVIMAEVKEITLAGPAILPSPNLAHEGQEAG